MSIIGSLPLPPEDLGALDRLVRRETDRLMRIRPQLDKSQERRPFPGAVIFYDRLEVILIGG